MLPGSLLGFVKGVKRKDWYVIELTHPGVPMDKTNEEQKFGLHIRRFKDVLRTYTGTIATLKLENNPLRRAPGENSRSHRRRLCRASDTIKDFYCKYKDDKGYDKEDRICCDFTAALYQKMGIISPNVETKYVITQDFIHDPESSVGNLFRMPPVHIEKLPPKPKPFFSRMCMCISQK